MKLRALLLSKIVRDGFVSPSPVFVCRLNAKSLGLGQGHPIHSLHTCEARRRSSVAPPTLYGSDYYSGWAAFRLRGLHEPAGPGVTNHFPLHGSKVAAPPTGSSAPSCAAPYSYILPREEGLRRVLPHRCVLWPVTISSLQGGLQARVKSLPRSSSHQLRVLEALAQHPLGVATHQLDSVLIAVAVPASELAHLPVKMPSAHLVVGAVITPLEPGPEVLDAIGVSHLVHVLTD